MRGHKTILAAAAGALLLASALVPAHGAPEGAEPPARLVRLTSDQYRAVIAEAFGPDVVPKGRFEPDIRVDGLLGVGAGSISVSPDGMAQYDMLARSVAEQVVAGGHRARLVGCTPAAGDPKGEACARQFFERHGPVLYRRPLAPAELDLAVANTLVAVELAGSFDAGLATSLAAMLVDLPFLFRIETAVATPDGATLDGYSRASRLSFLLWNGPPDTELLRAAQSGSLMTPDGLAQQVDRMLASPRLEQGMRAFLSDFLHLDALASVRKDSQIYPAFRGSISDAAHEQTLRTAIHLLLVEDGDFRTIYTSRRIAMSRQLSAIYRVPHAPRGWAMTELPADSGRAGLLTHVAFLAMHGHEGRSSATLRGLGLRETLLCEEISPPPANVNFTIVQDTSNPDLRTARSRLQAHLTDDECASCHRKTDLPGLVLEQFDGAGQRRLYENGEVIDISGMLDAVAVADPAALGQAMHDNPKAAACFVQSLWKAGTARPVRAGDDLKRLESAFAADGYRLRGLLRAMATSPAFYLMEPAVPPVIAGTRPKQKEL